MCGINGRVRSAQNDQAIVSIMNDRLAHRGPDFMGIYSDEHIVLGHRLLAIRDDVEPSQQPYAKKGSPWVLVFNGQIYNTDQLKKELPDEFKHTDLDTAILYGAIEKYGWDFIERVHGMFAIALYNSHEKIVRLYRDPSGQKLLYYYAKGSQFVFSSEIRGILADTAINKSIDYEAVVIATVLGFIPGAKTIFGHISKVNPSEIVTYHIASNTLSRTLFISRTEHYYTGTMEDTLDMLIREHLKSKRKIALNLSGGLDSSLLLHEMSRVGYDIHSYTTRFDTTIERYNRDAECAQRLAKEYGATHTEVFITKKEYVEHFARSYQIIEEPRHNISIPVYYITAKNEGIHGDKNRVILSGDGGDEVFGGYPRYARTIRDDALIHLVSPFIFNTIRNLRNQSPNLDFRNPVDRWYFYKYFKYSKASYLTHPLPDIVPKYIQNASNNFIKAYRTKSGSVYGCMLIDRVLWLAGENFIRSDKLYMSQSVEMRNPLAYHPFRVYMDSLLRERDYVNTKINKVFLRSYAEGKLPSYIVNRPDKTGWRAPLIDAWYDKNIKNLYLEIISDAERRGSGIVDWKRTQKTIEQTDGWPGRNAHFMVAFAALSHDLSLSL